MTERLRHAPPWLAAAAASCAVGLLAERMPLVAIAVVIAAVIAALAALVRDLPVATLYVSALVVSSSLVDLPGQVQLGSNTSNALITIVYSSVGLLMALAWRRSPANSAAKPLLPFALLIAYATLATVAFATSVAFVQNVLVFLVFTVAALAGIAVADQRGATTTALASRVFGFASAIALCLYAASLATGGLESGTVIGNRSFALFALLIIAWGAAGWRHGSRHGRTLALLAGLFIVLSLSRTAFAAALLLFCIVWIDPRTTRGWLRPIGAATAALTAAYLASVYIEPLHERIYTGDLQQVAGGFTVNVTGRTDLWDTAWQSFLTAPYFGQGAGSVDTLITRVYGAGIGHVHNDYIKILHDYGIVGGVLWVTGYVWLLRRTWRAWQGTSGDAEGASRIHAAAFLALLGVAVAMITDNVISYLFVMGPLGVLVGLSLGLAFRESRPAAAPAGPGGVAGLVPPPPAPARSQPALSQFRAYAQPSGPRPPPLQGRPAGSAQPLVVSAGRSDLQRLVRGGSLNLVGGLSSAALTFGFTVLITHQLGAAGSGVFFQAIGIFTILFVVCQLGAGTTIVKTLAAQKALGRHGDFVTSLRAALLPGAAASVLAGAGIFVFAPQLAVLLVESGRQDDAHDYLRVLALFLPLAVLSSVLLSATRGLGSMLPTALLDSIAKPAFRFAFAALGTLVALSPAAIGALWAAPVGLALVLTIIPLRRLIRQGRLEGEETVAERTPSRAVVSEFWRFTLPQWLAEVSQLAVLWIDIVLLGALASSREAGVYGAISRIVLVGTIGLAAVALILGPLLSALTATAEMERVRKLYTAATVALAAGSIPIFLVIATFSHLLAGIFGDGFADGDIALTILALAMAVEVAAGPALLMLLMAGRSTLILLDSGVAFVANIVLNIVLIPPYGMTGAAIAWSASIIVSNALAVIQMRHLWGIQPFGRPFAIVTTGAAVCFGGGSLAAVAIAGQQLSTLVVASAVELLVYGAILWILRAKLGFSALLQAVRARGGPALEPR